MIRIDIPLPETCEECPCSYWIQSGKDEGRLMCNAMEFAGKTENIVEEGAADRPDGCPIIDEDSTTKNAFEEKVKRKCLSQNGGKHCHSVVMRAEVSLLQEYILPKQQTTAKTITAVVLCVGLNVIPIGQDKTQRKRIKLTLKGNNKRESGLSTDGDRHPGNGG